MKNEWKYIQTDPTRVVVREIELDSGKGGDDAVIVFMTDPHFNSYTEKDLEDEVLASTIEYRKWNANGASVQNLERGFEYARLENADAVVIGGDVLDFLSEGCIKLMKENLWDKYPDTIVCLGNHEAAKKVQGKVADKTPIEEKLDILQKNWNHNVRYYSRAIKDKAMVIALDNASMSDMGYIGFFDEQIELLAQDLSIARDKEYKVFLLYHIPISTLNKQSGATKASMIGDKNSNNIDFCYISIGPWVSEATKKFYELIANNADIIGGCLCGHVHSDFYTEIKAKDYQGNETTIPQYVMMGMPYGKGHVMTIRVK